MTIKLAYKLAGDDCLHKIAVDQTSFEDFVQTNFHLLTYLDCHSCKLTILPDPLPPNLIVLDCSKNNLAVLPNLPVNLAHLYCYDNILSSLPNIPTKLTLLYCHNNHLSVFPEFHQSSLSSINCSNNNLVSLSFESSVLPKLTHLDCSKNQLTSLLSDVQLPKLNTLICKNNKLTILPNLSLNLDFLDCSNNQIVNIKDYDSSQIGYLVI
jgi:Leucine-rich repeat (LRR) protein